MAVWFSGRQALTPRPPLPKAGRGGADHRRAIAALEGQVLVGGDTVDLERLRQRPGRLPCIHPLRGYPGSGVCSTGLATLRRDGFASMDADAASGTVPTRPVRFRGRYHFGNAAGAAGELRPAVLDEAG